MPEPYADKWVSECGSVTLYRGGALAILPTIDPDGVAVVTDPPYGISLKNNDRDGHRSARSFAVSGDKCQTAGVAVLEWAAVNELTTIAFASPSKPWPGEWRNLIAWDKGGAVGGGGDIRTCLKRTWELIQVARNGAMNGMRDGCVWRHPMIPADTAEHICRKPVDLMVRLIERFTQRDDTVFDPFMGSGATGEACLATDRGFIGIEIDPTHFATAKRRIQAALADRASLLIA